MTHLLTTLIEHALVRLEQGVEQVSDPPARSYRRRKEQAEEKQ
jgi:hypothetical protein